MHIFPTRQFMIAFVHDHGAKLAYGPKWKLSDKATIAYLKWLSDADYATQCGCNHHDERGNCLGHDEPAEVCA